MADYKAYPTQSGQQFEATAKVMGYPIQVAWVLIGKGILPDDQSPYLQTKLIDEIKRFPATVLEDEDNPGVWYASCTIPGDDHIDGKGYVVNELGLELGLQGKGILYAYRRAPGDVKQVITDGSATSIYYRIKFIPSRTAIVNATIDPTISLVSQKQFDASWDRHQKDPHAHQLSVTLTGGGELVSDGYYRFMAKGTLQLDPAAPTGAMVVAEIDHQVGADCGVSCTVPIITPRGSDIAVRWRLPGVQRTFIKQGDSWRVS